MENIIKDVEAKIANAQSDEEVLKIFADAGYPITREQLEAETADGELSEDMLDAVSGGSVMNWIRRAIDRYRARRNASNYNGGGGGFSSGGGGGHAFGGGGGGGR